MVGSDWHVQNILVRKLKKIIFTSGVTHFGKADAAVLTPPREPRAASPLALPPALANLVPHKLDSEQY